jgi:hypothetical protein
LGFAAKQGTLAESWGGVFVVIGDSDWGFVGFGADPVDGSVDGSFADEGAFEFVFAREVEEGEGDEDGEDALAGGDEHGEASDEEDEAKEVFEDAEGPADGGVGAEGGEEGAVGVGEVVLGEAGEDPGDDEEGGDEGDDRGGGEEGDEGLGVGHGALLGGGGRQVRRGAEIAEGAEKAEDGGGKQEDTPPSVTLRVTPPPEARGRREDIGWS